MAKSAYLVISCQFGKENSIVAALYSKFGNYIDKKNTFSVIGVYDVITKITFENESEDRTVMNKMKKEIEGINSILSLVTMN